MEISEIASEFVVDELKEEIKKIENDYDYIIMDTAAGTHCDVISAVGGVDIVFAVTEPTPLGEHDVSLILNLLKKLNLDSKLIINRSDIADSSGVKSIAGEYGVEVAAEIGYSKKVLEQYSRGVPVEHEAIEKLAGSL